MKLSEVPEQYRIYIVCMSNGSRHQVNGTTKKAIMDVKTSWVELPNGNLLNKNFIVEFKLNIEATKENVQEHAEEIKNAIIT